MRCAPRRRPRWSRAWSTTRCTCAVSARSWKSRSRAPWRDSSWSTCDPDRTAPRREGPSEKRFPAGAPPSPRRSTATGRWADAGPGGRERRRARLFAEAGPDRTGLRRRCRRYRHRRRLDGSGTPLRRHRARRRPGRHRRIRVVRTAAGGAAGGADPGARPPPPGGNTSEAQAGRLDASADHYLTKPFFFPELLARLRALLRRGRRAERSAMLSVGDLQLDTTTKRVHRSGSPIVLTAKEHALLEYFMRCPGRVLSRADLLEHVWDFAFDGDPHVVAVYVGYLREKIDKPFRRRSLETVRGMGYRLHDDRSHDDRSHDDLDGIEDRRRGAVRREWAPIHVREPVRRGFVRDGGQPPP